MSEDTWELPSEKQQERLKFLCCSHGRIQDVIHMHQCKVIALLEATIDTLQPSEDCKDDMRCTVTNVFSGGRYT